MARLARVVIPEVPHHIAQRGNRRQAVFFSPARWYHSGEGRRMKFR